MNKTQFSLIALILISIGLLWTPKENKKESITPSIDSIIDTSVQSLSKQAELTVMTAKINSVGTSRFHQYGMTAEQTDIVSVDARYSIDLSKLSKKDFKFKDGTLHINLPKIKRELVKPVKEPLSLGSKRYTNGSMLFTLDSTERTLSKNNNNLIKKDLNRQMIVLIPYAMETAKAVTKPIFRMVLDSSGAKNIKIKIDFQK